MIPLEEFHGRAREVSISADLEVDFRIARLWLIDATVGSLNVDMPPATDYGTGGPLGIIVMATGSSSVTIRDNGGTAITLSDGGTTLDADECAKMLLIDNADADGEWAGKVAPVGTAPNPTPAELSYIAGGFDGSSRKRNEEYNHQTDTSTSKTFKNQDATNGGSTRTGSTGVWYGSQTAPRNKVERYTPSADSWGALGDKPTDFQLGQSGRGGGSATLGYTLGDSTDRDGTDRYTNGTDTWDARTDKTTDCIQGGGFNDPNDPDDNFACNGNEFGVGNVTTVERYTGSTDTWNSRAASPSPGRIEFATVGWTDKGMKLGGTTSSDVDVYGISTNVWVGKTLFPAASPNDEDRKQHGMTAPEDIVHLFGGATLTVSKDETWRYNEGLDSWTQKQDMQDTRTGIAHSCLGLTP